MGGRSGDGAGRLFGDPPRSGICVVVNRLSRRHRGDGMVMQRLRQLVQDQGVVVAPNGRGELLAVAQELRARGVDVVAISGGDGTMGFTVDAFAEVYGAEPLPTIAPLRGGTMNTVANALGVPRRRPFGLLRRLLQHRARGQPLRGTSRVALRVEQEDGTCRHGFLLGTGLGYAFLEEYYAAGRPHPTPSTAARTLGRIAASMLVQGETARRLVAPTSMQISTDEQPWPDRSYLMVLAGTVEQVGLGFRPLHRAIPNQDAFHLLGIHGHPMGVVARLPRARLGRPFGSTHSQDATATEALLRPASGQVGYFLDGDLYQAEGALRVGVGPRVQFVWA